MEATGLPSPVFLNGKTFLTELPKPSCAVRMKRWLPGSRPDRFDSKAPVPAGNTHRDSQAAHVQTDLAQVLLRGTYMAGAGGMTLDML